MEFVRGEDAGILIYGEFFKPIMFLNSRTIAMKLILFLKQTGAANQINASCHAKISKNTNF